MFTTTEFRLQIQSGRREFPVTAEELEVLQALGRELGFSAEVVQALPDRLGLDGVAKPQQLVTVPLPTKR